VIELERNPSDLDDAEKKWIAKLEPPLNRTEGGNGFGGPHHPDTKKKIAAASLGRKASPETRALISERQRERKRTPEEVDRLRELAFAMRGTTQSAEQKNNDGAAVHAARTVSGYRDVSWDSYHHQWRARVKNIHLGYFDDPKEADEAVKAFGADYVRILFYIYSKT